MVQSDVRPSEPAEAPSILSKAFDLLRAFTSEQRVLTLSELSRASGLPKSTVHRLLARLVELGAVEHHRAGYKIGLTMLQIGGSTPAGYMRDLALPHLARLHRWRGEMVSFAVLRGFDVVYLEKIATENLAPRSTCGAHLPANCTAIGKALLAWEDQDDLADFLPARLPALTAKSVTDVGELMSQLRKVRDEGVARESEEAQPGLACTAAPVLLNGYAVGALSVGHALDKPPAPGLEDALVVTATAIARDVEAGLARGGREHWFPREL